MAARLHERRKRPCELIFPKQLGLNGAMVESRTRPLPKVALRHCIALGIALALTYHRNGAKDHL
jgi:hypothetical protein